MPNVLRQTFPPPRLMATRALALLSPFPLADSHSLPLRSGRPTVRLIRATASLAPAPALLFPVLPGLSLPAGAWEVLPGWGMLRFHPLTYLTLPGWTESEHPLPYRQRGSWDKNQRGPVLYRIHLTSYQTVLRLRTSSNSRRLSSSCSGRL
jgi:hypothetical protein